MTVVLQLKPELEADLVAHARSLGVTPEEYLQRLLERELSVAEPEDAAGSGMVWEDGLFIYGEGTPLSHNFLDGAIRRSREERSRYLLGVNS